MALNRLLRGFCYLLLFHNVNSLLSLLTSLSLYPLSLLNLSVSLLFGVACERAKHSLSSSTLAHVELDSLQGVDFYNTITRARFEHICSDLWKRALVPLHEVWHLYCVVFCWYISHTINTGTLLCSDETFGYIWCCDGGRMQSYASNSTNSLPSLSLPGLHLFLYITLCG